MRATPEELSQHASRQTVQEYLSGKPIAVAQVDRWIRDELRAHFPVLKTEADDVCQVVHGKLFGILRDGAFRYESSLRTFVSRVTRFSALDHIRRRYRDPLWSTQGEGPAAARQGNPYRSLMSLEKGALLGQILVHASGECRQLWHLAFVEELSYDDIARRLNLAPGTIKSRMSRCRQRVMLLLRRADD
ncbi:MAG: RNA polymerase sigma factor [Candidatus Polarisedimenticolia bacterium]